MPSRKAAEAEILTPEADQPSQKIREVKHKTEWVEVIEEAPRDAEIDLGDDDVIEEKPKRRVNTDRDQLRKKLAKNGVTPTSQLKLTIEKYPHSDVIDGQGGVYADTAHCAKYACTEAHLLNEDYLDVARKFGPGLYRFTLREKNQIVTAWDKRISEGASTGPVIQHVNPNDPTSPQVIVQMPEGSQQPMPIVDPFKEAERALNFVEKYNRAFGRFQPQAGENPARSEEEIIAGAIIKQPAVIESVVESIVKRVGGKGSGDDEPWYAGAVKDAIKSGQGAQIVKTAIDAIFTGFKGLFPGGQVNGQTQMAPTQVQNQPTEQGAQVPLLQTQQQSDVGNSQSAPEGHGSTELPQGIQNQTQTVTPEQHALTRLIHNCQRNVPVQVAFQQLINYADAVNEQAPDYSIDGYIDLLGAMPTDQVIEFVKGLPGGEQVVALPHAKEWTAELQRLIKESQEGEAE